MTEEQQQFNSQSNNKVWAINISNNNQPNKQTNSKVWTNNNNYNYNYNK